LGKFNFCPYRATKTPSLYEGRNLSDTFLNNGSWFKNWECPMKYIGLPHYDVQFLFQTFAIRCLVKRK